MRKGDGDERERRYPMFTFPAWEWKPSLYEYIYMMSAHSTPLTEDPDDGSDADVVVRRQGDTSSAGNCKLDFITPTSNMQLHTLVAAL